MRSRKTPVDVCLYVAFVHTIEIRSTQYKDVLNERENRKIDPRRVHVATAWILAFVLKTFARVPLPFNRISSIL